MPLDWIAPFLPPLFFMGESVSTSISTNIRDRWHHYPGLILKFFFEKILVIPKFSLTQFGVESNLTLSFSRKRYKTRSLILNTFNLFSKNLMKRELQKNPNLFGSSAKVSVDKSSDRTAGREYNCWKKLIQKTINTEAKAYLQL